MDQWDGQPVVTGGPPAQWTDGMGRRRHQGAGRVTINKSGGSTFRPEVGVGGVGAIGAGGSSSGGPALLCPISLERIRQVYKMSECQMAHLTVLWIVALVCRRIRPRFQRMRDITEVLFENLSPAIDKDSNSCGGDIGNK
ncbi:Protein F37C4.5 [Fasciola gigantica]|uniref:Protein F37C4.5 n=1 Tax=Fasciola gigantica TaxID=46835 RepID=A0A504YIP7_FASGI|nr:Protein F37C4.5 [Fasciola gigantica]